LTLSVPLKRPSNFPVNTFFAQSFLRLLSLESPKDLDIAIQAFFASIWHDDLPLDSAETIQTALEKQNAKLSMNGSELKTFIERAISKEERNKLSKESEILAKDEGCFGMP
jgi:2-hydroxychromene-2-carboxylate isomerase